MSHGTTCGQPDLHGRTQFTNRRDELCKEHEVLLKDKSLNNKSAIGGPLEV
jgi:hypothetical protein